MRKSVVVLAVGLALVGAMGVGAVTPGIKLSVTTSNPPTIGEREDAYVMAMWIQNSTGSFVKSFGLWAAKRKQYLYTWMSVNGGDTLGGSASVDGVTSATKTGYGTMSASWDLKNKTGTRVPNGEYWVCAEFTELHAQGPMVKMKFNINGTARNASNITPDSSKASGTNYITAISIDYTESNVSIEPVVKHSILSTGARFINHNQPVFNIAGRLTGTGVQTPGVLLQRSNVGTIRAVSIRGR